MCICIRGNRVSKRTWSNYLGFWAFWLGVSGLRLEGCSRGGLHKNCRITPGVSGGSKCGCKVRIRGILLRNSPAGFDAFNSFPEQRRDSAQVPRGFLEISAT